MFDDNDLGLRRTAATVVAVAITLLAGLPAASAGSDKSLDAVLGEIEWGDTKEEVFKKLKAEMFKKLRQNESLKHDRVKMQEARKRMMEKLDRIKKSYTELDEDTGYDVSVISGEFTKNNNEALLKINDKAAQRFFFFADGRFYKMVVAYRQNYLDGVGFKAFVGQVSNKYGRPDGTDYADIAGEETLATATWKSEGTLLNAKNKKEMFGTFVMVFSDRQRVKKMRKQEGAFGGSDKNEEDVSNRVESLKEDSGTDTNENVVDGMIGEDVEVDISTKEEDVAKQGPAGQSERAVKKEEQKEEKSKQAEASDSEESSDDEQEQERDFSNLSSDSDKKKKGGDDELIVY